MTEVVRELVLSVVALEVAADVVPDMSDDPVTDLARILAAAEAGRDRLELVRQEVARLLLDRMDGSRQRTEVGLLEQTKEGGSTVWDSSKVWPAVYRQARRRADKGFEPVDAALAALREAAPDPDWRAGVLAGWGIDVDQVAERVPARRTVRLIPNRPHA